MDLSNAESDSAGGRVDRSEDAAGRGLSQTGAELKQPTRSRTHEWSVDAPKNPDRASAFAISRAATSNRSPRGAQDQASLATVATDKEKPHALESGPTAGYALKGVGNDRLATGLAGLIGVSVTFAIAGGLFLVVRQTRRTNEAIGHGVT